MMLRGQQPVNPLAEPENAPPQNGEVSDLKVYEVITDTGTSGRTEASLAPVARSRLRTGLSRGEDGDTSFMEIGRILVVDDEAAIRELLVALLERQGHECASAGSVTEALGMLTRTGYDLVLSDIMMSGMDGMELLDNVGVMYPEIPVVMVTAVHDIAVAMASIRRGAYDYLLKPFDREQLHAVVSRALTHRRLTMQNQAYKENLESLVAARTDLLRKAMADLERSYDITLEALGDALDLKDAETQGHSKRVTAYTIALARAMGINHKEMRVIARGAFLHDVGKMAIPDAILLKPGALTDSERAIMCQHCMRGYEIVRKIPFLREAAEIVYSHQEWFDGSGYPRGLHGREIPVGARMFAVADTLDAITSDRPYRKGRGFDVARREIGRGSGTQFDPEIVQVFLALPESLWEELRMEIELHAKRFISLEQPAEVRGPLEKHTTEEATSYN
jgi:putative nucleotidyltransferase with HDIG domain